LANLAALRDPNKAYGNLKNPAQPLLVFLLLSTKEIPEKIYLSSYEIYNLLEISFAKILLSRYYLLICSAI